MQPQTNRRIETLDWLRGLMATSIMVYHYTSWIFFVQNASTFLGRLGIYGVSIFFILSGLSMAIVYSKYIDGLGKSINFFIRRIFRIWPLFWIFILLTVLPGILNGGRIGWLGIFANMTTIFGFIRPDAGIDTIAWSIGNEMVYYALTPLIIVAFNKKVLLGNTLAGITFFITCLFGFFFLNRSEPFGQQLSTYVNPFNNLFLYVTGIAIYYNLKDKRFDQVFNITIFALALSFLIFYPVSGDLINIVTGINRLLFMLASVLLVISFYKFELYNKVPQPTRNGLEQLGFATYGIYLLHPIVWGYIGENLIQAAILDNSYIIFSISALLTIFASLLSYHFFEKRFIQVGKKLTTR